MVAGRIIAVCWVIFLVYWVISARSVKRTAERQSRAESLAYRIPGVVGTLLLIIPDLREPLDWVVFRQRDLPEALGVALCVAGLGFAIWARQTLADNWSSMVTFKEGHKLIDRGPYRFVRHPIYTGMLVMALGSALAADRVGSFAGLLCWCMSFWIKLTQEEKLMARHFPDEYPAYKKRVKALVPFVI